MTNLSPFHDSRHNTSLRYLICTRNNTRPRDIDCERFEIQSKTSYRFGLNVCVRIRPGKLAAPPLCRIATSALPPRPPLSTLFSRYSCRLERNSCRERIEDSMEEGEWFSNEGSVAKGAKGRRNGTEDFGWKGRIIPRRRERFWIVFRGF